MGGREGGAFEREESSAPGRNPSPPPPHSRFLLSVSQATSAAASAPSFTPRLLIFEERESLGVGLGNGNVVSSAAANSLDAWAGLVTRTILPPLPPSPWTTALADESDAATDLAAAASALSLDGGITAWPDFLKAPIPPACLAPVCPAWPRRGGGASGWGPPGGEGEGEAGATAAEGVRRLAEACDRLQGITLLVDDTGGWGAAAAAALGAIAEGGAVGERAPRLVGAVRPAGWWAAPARGACPDMASRTAACAASAAFLAPLADVFIPFDLPPGTGGGSANTAPPPSPSSPAGLFRAGAAAAAAWEGLTTPARLVRGGPAASACTGAADLASLASLVAGPRGHNRWGWLAAGLPAAGAPPPAPPGGEAPRPPARPPHPPFTAAAVTSWTARIPPPDGSRARALLAESVVWRGPTAAGGCPLPLAAAAEALDAALGAEAAADARTAAGGVAVRHRCLALQALALPLPWPAGFPRSPAPPAASAPLLTRLACVRGVGAARAAAAKDLARAAATAPGRVALGPAGVDADALADGLESLGERGGGSSSDDDW